MRNVNFCKNSGIFSAITCFILTMRNVNSDNFFIDEFKALGFILTMRNVNDVNKRIKIKPRKVLY